MALSQRRFWNTSITLVISTEKLSSLRCSTLSFSCRRILKERDEFLVCVRKKQRVSEREGEGRKEGRKELLKARLTPGPLAFLPLL